MSYAAPSTAATSCEGKRSAMCWLTTAAVGAAAGAVVLIAGRLLWGNRRCHAPAPPSPPAPKNAAGEPIAKHYDAAALNTDAGVRMAYMADWVGFGADDIANIQDPVVVSHLAPAVPALVDAVYDKLFSFDVTKAFFVPQNEGFTGAAPKTAADLNLKHGQIGFRKEKLTKYLTKLVTADMTSPAFVAYIDWVGKIHSVQGGNRDIIIPMVHCEALFGYVQDALIGAIASFGLPLDKELAVIRSYMKVLSIQRSFFNKYLSQ